MKNSIIILISALLSFAAGSFFQSSERTATVEQTDGLFLFWECKPVDHYEVVGVIKDNGLTASNSYTHRKKIFIEKAKKYHQTADGIYYDPAVTGIYAAFVIKFK